ncbi:MAG: M67 family metallopeptidase [Armatimonadota bacterium]
MRIPSGILAEIIDHARIDAPVEACGLLAGTGSDIVKSYRLTNADISPEHFSLVPKEQFAVMKDARDLGLGILAVYHSHPETPARMSDEDLRLAVAPGFGYVIVSLANPLCPQAKCFRVLDGRPVEEDVIIQE